MRTPLILLFIALLLVFSGCGDPQKEVDEDERGIPDSIEMDEKLEPGLTSEGMKLIKQLAGEYYMLREEDDVIYYEESCRYNPYDVKIAEIAEGSGLWEIQSVHGQYSIDQAEEKSGIIYLTSIEDMERISLFMKHKNDLLWNFSMMGLKEASPVVKAEDIGSFDIRPCTDAEEIMKHLPSTWYELTEMDGKTVIYEPCEEATGGYDIGHASIDFRSGSDPYDIVSMSKANNRITIVYKSTFDEQTDSIMVHNLYGNVVQIGDGNSNDARYINEEAMDIYPIVKEDCD